MVNSIRYKWGYYNDEHDVWMFIIDPYTVVELRSCNDAFYLRSIGDLCYTDHVYAVDTFLDELRWSAKSE